MKRSDQINELAAALAKAQGEIKEASRDKENPHFRSTYATLASAWEACRSPLSKNGLAVIQSPSTAADGLVRITTLLTHNSGQWIEDSCEMTPRDASPQSFGSVVTYGRRYSLMAMVGIATGEDDDDGNAASWKPLDRQYQKPAPKMTAPVPVAPIEPSPRESVAILAKASGWTNEQVAQRISQFYNKAKVADLSDMELKTLMMAIKAGPYQEVAQAETLQDGAFKDFQGVIPHTEG